MMRAWVLKEIKGEVGKSMDAGKGLSGSVLNSNVSEMFPELSSVYLCKNNNKNDSSNETMPEIPIPSKLNDFERDKDSGIDSNISDRSRVNVGVGDNVDKQAWGQDNVHAIKDVKIYNVPLEAWNVEGISGIASRIGTPIIMDKVEIWYRSLNRTMELKVDYAWQPPVCSHCCVFGHSFKGCNNRVLSEEEKVKRNKAKAQASGEKGGMLKGGYGSRKRGGMAGNGFVNEGKINSEKKYVSKWPLDLPKYYMDKYAKKGKSYKRKLLLNKIRVLEGDISLRRNDIKIKSKKLANKGVVYEMESIERWTDEIVEFYQQRIAENGYDGDVVGKNIDFEGSIEDEVGRDDSAHAVFMTQNNVSSSVDAAMACTSGDFNIIMYADEHSKGSIHNYHGVKEFRACVEHLDIEDLARNGLFFTWVQKMKDLKSGIMKKQDRIMGNNEFLDQFGSCYSSFLPYITYDHCPGLLIIPNVTVKKRRSFRFMNFLAGKKQFHQTVRDKWNEPVNGFAMFILARRLRGMKMHLWSLNTKNEDEMVFNSTYREAVMDEEKVLKQKTKVEWLKEGDHNSDYLHNLLKGRLNRSRIIIVTDELGRVYEDEEVAGQFVSHFQSFLGTCDEVFPVEDPDRLFYKKLEPEIALNMVREVSDDEVKAALNDIDDNKAPRLDGFTFRFFKASWVTTDEFCLVLRLRPNMAKSTVFFGNVNDDVKRVIKTIMPFNKGMLPVKYLGMPLDSNKRICEDVDKLLKNFLWRNDDKKSCKNSVAWKDVCMQKSEGGLGLKSLQMWNEALMAKHLWNIIVDKDSIWVKWVKSQW
nr:hypothetical protein [Tanacetum cinerariifolium]